MPNAALGKAIIDRAREEGFRLYCLPDIYQVRSERLSWEDNVHRVHKMTMSPELRAAVTEHHEDILEALGCPKPRTGDD